MKGGDTMLSNDYIIGGADDSLGEAAILFGCITCGGCKGCEGCAGCKAKGGKML